MNRAKSMLIFALSLAVLVCAVGWYRAEAQRQKVMTFIENAIRAHPENFTVFRPEDDPMK